MPRKRPPVLTNPDKPVNIEGEQIELYRKITPKMLMNQYLKVETPKPPKPITYIEEKTTVSNLTDSITTKPMFKPPASITELQEIRQKAQGLLLEPHVSVSLLQQVFQNKRFPNGMKAICYNCGQDLFFMDDFFIHAAHQHGAMLGETVNVFLKLIDKIEKQEQGEV